MDDKDIVRLIGDLAVEERALDEREPVPERDQRLHDVEVALDQCWDLLRQRRARRAAGLDPDEAEVRSEGTVETFLQ